MSLWFCLDCTARYAVGLPECPQCQSTRYTDDPDRAEPGPAPVAPTLPAPGPAPAAAEPPPNTGAD